MGELTPPLFIDFIYNITPTLKDGPNLFTVETVKRVTCTMTLSLFFQFETKQDVNPQVRFKQTVGPGFGTDSQPLTTRSNYFKILKNTNAKEKPQINLIRI